MKIDFKEGGGIYRPECVERNNYEDFKYTLVFIVEKFSDENIRS
jgi:hypothetical protein